MVILLTGFVEESYEKGMSERLEYSLFAFFQN